MFRTTKKDMIFYDLFSVVMEDTCTGAEILEDLFRSFTNTEEKIDSLKKLEHKCDRTVHDVIDQLNRSFITPLDREDIYMIAKEIDNIMDCVESTAYRLKMFNITVIRPDSLEMADLVVNCAKVIRRVVDELRNMKNSKTLHDDIIEVNRLENQGDAIYRKFVRDLFVEEKDPLEIIKWKEIIEHMEHTLDACEDVANIIEGVVSKNA